MVLPLVVVVVVVAATLHTTGGITTDTDLDLLTYLLACMHGVGIQRLKNGAAFLSRAKSGQAYLGTNVLDSA